MKDQPILAERSGNENGIQSIVRSYVRLKNISALAKMKAHRLRLLAQHADSQPFCFKVFREHCQSDITAIDAGIIELMKQEPSRGFVDVFSPERIAGWAQYIQHSETPVMLGLYFDGQLALKVLADRYRSDLKAAGLGSGYHSFEFSPSMELFLRAAVIEVKTPNGKVIGEYRKSTHA